MLARDMMLFLLVKAGARNHPTYNRTLNNPAKADVPPLLLQTKSPRRLNRTPKTTDISASCEGHTDEEGWVG